MTAPMMRFLAMPALLAGVLLSLSSPATAQDTPVSITPDIGYRSLYLFAGIPFSTGAVTQGEVTVMAGSFTFHAYGVYDHDLGDASEADVWGDYYVQLDDVWGAYVGAALYHFNYGDTWEATPEVYGGVTAAVSLNPTLHVAHDFDLGDGTRFTFMVSEAMAAGPATVTFAANVDYNDGYYVDSSSFSYMDLALSVAVPVGPVTLTPSFLIQQAIDEGFTDEVVFGVNASMTF